MPTLLGKVPCFVVFDTTDLPWLIMVMRWQSAADLSDHSALGMGGGHGNVYLLCVFHPQCSATVDTQTMDMPDA